MDEKIKSLSERCQDLIELRIKQRKRFKEIEQDLFYATGAARVQYFKCKEKLISLCKNDSYILGLIQ